jgi:hypothetical protein
MRNSFKDPFSSDCLTEARYAIIRISNEEAQQPLRVPPSVYAITSKKVILATLECVFTDANSPPTPAPFAWMILVARNKALYLFYGGTDLLLQRAP